MKSFVFTPLLLIGFLFLSGCTTIQVNHAAVGKIRRLAIIGYNTKLRVVDSYQTAPKEIKIGGIKIEFDFDQVRRLIPPDIIVKEINLFLKNDLKWDVRSVQAVRSDPLYLSTHKRLNSRRVRWLASTGIGIGFMSDSNSDYLEGILSSYDARKIPYDERNELISKLGVDAVAIIEVGIELYRRDHWTIGSLGLGSYEPKVRVNFYVYDRSSKDPIWKDINATGKGDASDQYGGVGDQQKLRDGSFTGLREAMKSLIQRYRKHKSEIPPSS